MFINTKQLYEGPVYNTTLVDRMQEKHQIEMVTQKVADIHEDIKLEKNKEEQLKKYNEKYGLNVDKDKFY